MMTPDFPSWKRETLDQFAIDAYVRLAEQEQAIEQLRGDLREAMRLLRESRDA